MHDPDPDFELSWAPPWAQHVRGSFERFDSTDPAPIGYKIWCERCGQTWRGTCSTGRVRDRIARFALLHRECEAGKSDE